MKPWLVKLLTFAIPGLIVSIGIVAWSFALTGRWPPQFLLISGSLGGMSSPLLWASIRRLRDRDHPATHDTLESK